MLVAVARVTRHIICCAMDVSSGIFRGATFDYGDSADEGDTCGKRQCRHTAAAEDGSTTPKPTAPLATSTRHHDVHQQKQQSSKATKTLL
ncbi:hypothetical protein PTSG_12848 [Salpingoeca rosetta]|uniref:Uncharacterized protein n=1 Tax=Salpingoeca rosetta (strain ATCC 50818 / BSB-021) TaxID=946362 RepID=F2UN25_SALR5|nr:uncharacterized protein PTSG_12848 [Salpingoeca rosetta]EGD78524.1 hypothetical protein PTSG_12848 [Salpingoeca rosetta]|eukprot:XP_004989473.1 hypothetical protein PTSG_12848 [Salpingoeca rosetta]